MDRWPGDFRRCWAVVELSHRSVGPTAPSRGPLQLELVQALAVVGQRHQVPLTGHLVEAAQRESGEAEGRLDDAEDRLDGLLAQPVQRTAFLAVELGGHDFEPFGLGFLHRHLGLGRAEVVAPPTARRPGRHQSLNVALGKRRDLVAVGIAVVRQHRRGPAENGRDRRDVRHQLIAVAGAVGDPGAHDQLRAPGIHHGLSVIGLAVLVLLALAHQPAVRIAQIALLVGARRLVGRLRVLALGPAGARLARRHLGLVVRPLGLGARLGPSLEAPTRRKPIAQGLPACDLPAPGGRPHPRRRPPRHAPSDDVQLELIDQLARPLISHPMLARRGLELAAVDADKPDLDKLQLLGQQNLHSRQTPPGCRAERSRVSWSGWTLHEAHPDIAVRRALDPPGIAIDQQRQHHPRVILRRAGATMVDLEGAHLDPLDRLDHEVRQIILRVEDRAEAETPGSARIGEI